MNFFLALLWVDLRRYWSLIALFAAMGAFMPLTVTGHGQDRQMRAVQMVIAFSVLISGVLTPFWLVGMDRVRRSMSVLWRLPVSRTLIVSSKLGISVSVNAVVLLLTALELRATGTITPAETIQLIGFGIPVSWVITEVCLPVYFLIDPQIGSLVAVLCAGVTAAICQELLKALFAFSPVAALVFLYTCALLGAFVSIRFTNRSLERRLILS